MHPKMMLLVVACVATVMAAPAEHEVHSLPGWTGALPSKHYSGLVNVGNGRSLHYYLQLSEGDPSKDPTVLWLNGGPGASSLMGGLTELGQVVFNRDSLSVGADAAPKLAQNEWAWTKHASVFYLESPAGVGYSYCDYANCTSNDVQAADDASIFLQKFYGELFPEFSHNKFFITGESYAGVYIPMLAQRLLALPAAAQTKMPRLSGLAIGNGCWGNNVGTCSFRLPQKLILSKFYRGKGMMSEAQYTAITEACGSWEQADDAAAAAAANGGDDDAGDDDTASAACQAAVSRGMAAVGAHNLYNVDDFCAAESPFMTAHEWLDSLGAAHSMTLDMHASGRAGNVGKAAVQVPAVSEAQAATAAAAAAAAALPALGSVQRWCGATTAMHRWLSRNDTAAALHVTLPWGRGLHYIGGPGTRTGPAADLRPVYKELVQQVPVMIYSGESDGCVPYVGTEAWTTGLGFPQTTAWHPWYGNSGAGGRSAAAGYAIRFGGASKQFSFVTIKGAGHEVPEFMPAASFDMINAFMNGTAL